MRIIHKITRRSLKNYLWFDFAHHPELVEGERKIWSVHLWFDKLTINR